jgi:hypothetical protein
LQNTNIGALFERFFAVISNCWDNSYIAVMQNKTPLGLNRTWVAAVAAVLVQPVVLAIRLAPDLIGSTNPIYGLGFMVLAVIAVAAAVLLLVGLPTFFILRRFGRENRSSVGLAGFVLGALPVAFFWPSRMEGYSSGQNWHGYYVELYVNGAPTQYAWFTYAENVLFFGLHGFVGAMVFYAIWRRLGRPNQSFPPTASGIG